MADDGLTQDNLDVMVEEEWEEDMETGAPPSTRIPTPPGESPMLQGSKTEDVLPDDKYSQSSEDSTDDNPPWDSDINKDELLGPAMDVSIPGGHSNDSITLVIPLEEDNLL